ncbi:signal peptide peptidase SppA [Desulfosarcina cetonica]|uniref:signal peptide peptidase SppA n=1 Tax=Desulfosarcina cetonica TaxID=90730 RepID=UPI00155DCD07|nr:signal peptide peptidase SppA [Desulfosarcina cetonica]
MVVWVSKGGERADGESIGVVEIVGAIADSRDALKQLRRFREDDTIKAIVVRIDSPGGAVGPSQEIYREIRKTIGIKKVVASMGAVAASGGYYVACAADGIVANPGTITGSIGVIMGYTNFRELLDKIGLVPVVIKSGAYKDTGSPTREMREDERELLQAVTSGIHEQFITAIAEGRHMDREKVVTAADGRIFTGETAKAQGLVDRLGNFEDALAWAGELGGVKGPVIPVYAPDEKLSLLRYLFSSKMVPAWLSKLVSPEIYAEYRYRP